MANEAQPDLEPSHPHSSHADLSKREREVLRLIGSGKAVKEIAAVLALSETTISTYRTRILIKLGLKSTAELIRYAVMNRLAD
jgi:DNA-binding NarL/FixJ family response regulator